jgi:RNA polymerase sigma-70 factor, ECF subfamily
VDRDQILLRLRERIVSFAASHMGRDSAEDLAQETLVVLEEKYRHVTRLEDLLPLSLQIVRFKMGALRRKTARRGEYTSVSVEDVPLLDHLPDPGQTFERKQMRERLRKAVGEMEERCREMFRMKLEGKTFEDIRQRFDVASINTIYTWDLRCRKKLLEKMGGSWEQRARHGGHDGEGGVQ